MAPHLVHDLQLAQAGDSEALTRLWVQMGQKIARKTSKRCPEHIREDLIQEGFFAFEKAVQVFDPTRGPKFETCAHWFIFRAQVQATYRQANPVYVPYYRLRQGVPSPQMAGDVDTLSYPCAPYPEALTLLTRYCTPEEATLLHQYYFQDLSLKQIGEQLSITRQAVWLRVRNALKAIRRGMKTRKSPYSTSF